MDRDDPNFKQPTLEQTQVGATHVSEQSSRSRSGMRRRAFAADRRMRIWTRAQVMMLPGDPGLPGSGRLERWMECDVVANPATQLSDFALEVRAPPPPPPVSVLWRARMQPVILLEACALGGSRALVCRPD